MPHVYVVVVVVFLSNILTRFLQPWTGASTPLTVGSRMLPRKSWKKLNRGRG